MQLLAESALQTGTETKKASEQTEAEEMGSLQERVDRLMGVINQKERPVSNMLFFVMYDIESNKVRYNVAKYLETKGCTRVQRSIFLADLPAKAYEIIKTDLAAVQAMYDNHDSIIICPVSTEMLNGMRIIGLDINIDIIAHRRNTLFF